MSTRIRSDRRITALEQFAATGRTVDLNPRNELPSEIRDNVLLLQREHRKGALAAHKIVALEALPGWEWFGSDRRRKGASARPIRALQAFVEAGGSCATIRVGTRVDGVHLSRAVTSLRACRRRGDLSVEAIDALDRLTGWSWDAVVARRSSASPEYGAAGGRRTEDQVFDLIDRYVSREGHARVPRFHVEDRFRLGSWIHVQRLMYRRGRMQPERAARLAGLPGWAWDLGAMRTEAKRQLATWEGTLAALKDYVGRIGSAAGITSETKWNEAYLAPALDDVRARHATRELPDALVREFSTIEGWDWTPNDGLGIRLEALRRYARHYHHSRVPRRYREGDLALGQWVMSLRKRKRAGTLPAGLTSVLESMPGWTWGRKSPRKRVPAY